MLRKGIKKTRDVVSVASGKSGGRATPPAEGSAAETWRGLLGFSGFALCQEFHIMAQLPLGAGSSQQSNGSAIEHDDWINHDASAQALRAAQARRSSGRRRLIDPTTSERDYAAAEIEFMNAMQAYKLQSGRMFPTWSEILEVLRGLGYEKQIPGQEFAAADN
jgi:hypothetical protein